MSTDGTTVRLSDERKRLFDSASEIVVEAELDDPLRSVVTDATLTLLIESKASIDDARGEVDPETIQQLVNTSVLAFHYRTTVDSRWLSRCDETVCCFVW